MDKQKAKKASTLIENLEVVEGKIKELTLGQTLFHRVTFETSGERSEWVSICSLERKLILKNAIEILKDKAARLKEEISNL
jgi:hypothetical protein